MGSCATQFLQIPEITLYQSECKKKKKKKKSLPVLSFCTFFFFFYFIIIIFFFWGGEGVGVGGGGVGGGLPLQGLLYRISTIRSVEKNMRITT